MSVAREKKARHTGRALQSSTSGSEVSKKPGPTSEEMFNEKMSVVVRPGAGWAGCEGSGIRRQRFVRHRTDGDAPGPIKPYFTHPILERVNPVDDTKFRGRYR